MMRKKHYWLLALLLLPVIKLSAQTKPSAQFLLLDAKELALYRRQYQAGDTCIIKQVKALTRLADTLLKAPEPTVTFKKDKLPPSGDKHDYMSLAPYWWPDSTKADGKPYIRRDGRTNPEKFLLHDRDQIGRIEDEVRKLAATYYFTGNELYAQKAVKMLRVFFLDAATKMNPNLNYAQYVTGVNDGRGIGIIETYGLINIPDAMAFLQGSKACTPDVNAGVKNWFREYLNWLQTSNNGIAESKEKNNHGTIYDLQVIDFSLYVGNAALAKKVLQERTIPRIDVQFTADGKQPLELARTKSWSYSNFNLLAWCRLTVLANKQGIDLWNYQTKSKKGIKNCVLFLKPYANGQQKWPFEQIEKPGFGEFETMLSLARIAYKFDGEPAGICPRILP
ncbi:alginate lyase family protein [Mucilaginibacter sp.]|uniref:alginate lyase family protein n=1 Tax=Mucilaginibacter sp. TaxID=1882438 RepID=UPI0035BC126D